MCIGTQLESAFHCGSHSIVESNSPISLFCSFGIRTTGSRFCLTANFTPLIYKFQVWEFCFKYRFEFNFPGNCSNITVQLTFLASSNLTDTHLNPLETKELQQAIPCLVLLSKHPLQCLRPTPMEWQQQLVKALL